MLVVGLVLAGLFVTPPVVAQQDSAEQATPEPEEEDVYAGQSRQAYDPETAVFGPLPRYKTDDGNFNIGAGALMQFDLGTYSQDPQGGTPASQALIPELEAGVKARRGIFLVSALLYQDFIFFGAHDFFDTGDVVQDGFRSAVLAYRGFDPLWFLIGQQNTSPPLDASTFSSRRMFMEEAMSSGAFGFAPGVPSLGVSTLYRTPHNYLRLGLHSVPAKDIGGDSEGYGVHGRATYAPIAERTEALHFGVAGYWRKPTVTRGETGGRERFSARPELRIDDTLVVDTGNIERIDSFYYGAVELLGVYG